MDLKHVVGGLIWMGACCSAMGQSGQQPNLPGVRALNPPVIDGTVEEAEWAAAPIASGWVERASGAPAPNDARVRIQYDDDFIYIGGQLDQDPSSVYAPEFRKNVSLDGNDYFYFGVDAFGTAQAVEIFFVNPRGATNIMSSSGRAQKTEWLGQFLAAGRTTETGWEFEARVPWNLLPLPPKGKHDLRINFGRHLSTTKQEYVWAFFKQDIRNFPHWTGVEVPGVKVDRSIKLLPFAYGGIDDNDEHIANAGLDMKTSLTNEVTLVGTINPDFRNIEQGVLSLDFSNFERLARDSRPFFIEGGEFIRTGIDQRLFASQRIDSFDFGAKAYGNISGRTQFGALTTLDFGERQIAVASVSHAIKDTDVFGFAYVGNREDGRDNDAVQLTYDKRVGDVSYYARGQFTDDEVTKTGSRANAGIYIQSKGIDYNAEYVQVTPEFNPRVGFSPEQDLKGINGNSRYTQSFSGGGVLETTYGMRFDTYDHFDGSHYRDNLQVFGSVAMRDGLTLEYGGLVENFEQYKNQGVRMSISKPRRDPFRGWEIFGTTGRFVDKYFRQVGVAFNYRPIEDMQFSLSHESVRHFTNDEQTIASLRYDIDAHRSVGGRLIRRNEDWNWYLSYRLGGGEGPEYYLILGNPNAQTFEHSVVFKVSVPLAVRR